MSSLSGILSKGRDIEIGGKVFTLYRSRKLSENGIRLLRLMPNNLQGKIVLKSKIFQEEILVEFDQKSNSITVLNYYCKNKKISIDVDKIFNQKVLEKVLSM